MFNLLQKNKMIFYDTPNKTKIRVYYNLILLNLYTSLMDADLIAVQGYKE